MSDLEITDYLGKYHVTVSPSFAIEDSLIEDGVWEVQVLRCIDYFVREGDCCVDVGANCGLLTIALADKAGPTGVVHAFEPSKVIFSRLDRNISLNSDLSSRVILHKVGIGERQEELKLFEAGEKPGNAYISDKQKQEYWNRGSADDFQNCEVDTLDSLFSTQKVDFIKIDVEGMELEVLRGSREVIKRDHPIIVYETLLSCFDNEKIKECEYLLSSLGYLFFIVHPIQHSLVPTRFPNLSEDTIAIHRDQVYQYKHLMFNQDLLELAVAESMRL